MSTIRKNSEKVVALRDETGSLRDDLAKLTTTLETFLSHQVDRTQNTAHNITKRVGGEMSHAKSRIGEYAHEHPAQICGMALGLGVVAGAFLLRRR